MSAGAMVLRKRPIFPQKLSPPLEYRVEVLLDEELGTISPNIYGHFAENLGGVIYGGIWVGEDSKIANVNGIRKRLVEEMRKIKPPVVRYPGGCFADSYDWRDGIGPSDKRPRRTNFWADEETATAPASHKYDPNLFGTNEFVRFCKLIGSQPYLAANVRSLPALEFSRWVEYCNSPEGSTSLADVRRQAGFADPFGVRFWGVGNESWGCGGNFSPQEYASEFRRYTAWVPRYGQELAFVASGPDVDNWNWTRGFFESIAKYDPSQLASVYGWALHDYAWNLSRGKSDDWVKAKGDAVRFDAVDWYEVLREGDRMETLIDGHWQIMGEVDSQHSVKLVVDEWGPWYRSGSESSGTDLLEQMPTLRDGVFSAMTLDIFNRNPEKIAMANCAQLINCLNSLYLAHEDKFCVTPVGHVMGMYADHQAGMGVRTVFSSPRIHYERDGKPANFWGLKGSASIHGKTLVLTFVNPDVSERREVEIAVRGAGVRSGKVTTLTHSDLHAHNTFEQPDAVSPNTQELPIAGQPLRLTVAAASVNKLLLDLV